MEQVIGSIVNEFGFRIDNRSWRQLDKFQKRISQLKKQMKGLGGMSIGNVTGASGANVSGSRGGGGGRRAGSMDKAHGQALSFGNKAGVKNQRETFELSRLGLNPDNYKKAKNTIDRLTGSFKNGKITLQEYNSKLAMTRKQYTDMSRKQKSLTGGMKDLRSMLVQITATMTAFAAGQAVMKTGQDFERMGVSMLAASDNAAQAESNLKYVRKEANRLGLDLVSANRGFVQLAANINKDFGNKNLRELFSGVSELATTLQLPAEDVQGTFRAISQMFGKNKIMAEEARQQLGERLPKAMKLLAEAAHRAGETTTNQVSALEELMKRGKALPDKILPAFSKVAKEFARNNGALEKSLKTNRIALNRLTTEFKDLQNIFFKSGFGEGLTALFNNLAKSLKDLNPMARTFGKIFSGAIKAISFALRIGSSILGGFFTLAEKIFGTAFGEWFGAAGAVAGGVLVVSKLALAFKAMAASITLANGSLLIMMRRLALTLAPALALEDVMASLSGKRSVVGGLANDLEDKLSGSVRNKVNPSSYSPIGLNSPATLFNALKNSFSSNPPVQVDVNLKSDMLEAKVDNQIDKKAQESINQQMLSVGE